MNLTLGGINTNLYGNSNSKSVFAGNLTILHNAGLKSTQEKLERQQKAGSQIQFWESKKESLKSMECSTVEEIADKLDMLHSYEDEIAAVKASYNNEQMFHVMDEAEELGEKLAEKAEENEPKTPEERRKEKAEESLEMDESKSVLDEIIENTEEIMEEVLEEEQEEMTEQVQDLKEITDEMQKNVPERELFSYKAAEAYRPFDIRI